MGPTSTKNAMIGLIWVKIEPKMVIKSEQKWINMNQNDAKWILKTAKNRNSNTYWLLKADRLQHWQKSNSMRVLQKKTSFLLPYLDFQFGFIWWLSFRDKEKNLDYVQWWLKLNWCSFVKITDSCSSQFLLFNNPFLRIDFGKIWNVH